MPSTLLRDEPGIRTGLKYLLKHDPVFSVQGWCLVDFQRKREPPSFQTLVRIIIGQQVSVAAANTMWSRLQAARLIGPRQLAAAHASDLRPHGISSQKAAYLLGLAAAVKSRAFLLTRLAEQDDETVLAEITALKGFGVWSAQMFMMFALARPDIWPAGDLAIQKGMQVYHRHSEKPDIRATEKMGNHFAPYRTAAALMAWKLSVSKAPVGL